MFFHGSVLLSGRILFGDVIHTSKRHCRATQKSEKYFTLSRPGAGDEKEPENKPEANEPGHGQDAGQPKQPVAVDGHDEGGAGWGKPEPGAVDAPALREGDDHGIDPADIGKGEPKDSVNQVYLTFRFL